jgi:hypothetical protein
MAIKLIYSIILIYPLSVFSQGKSFFIEPMLNTQFGTKSNYEILKQESENIELNSLNKLGNIDYSSISLGLGIGFKFNYNSITIMTYSLNTLNGYSCLYNPNNNVLQSQSGKLVVNSRRPFFGIRYALELERYKVHKHSLSMSYGLSFNRSVNTSPHQLPFVSFISIDSTDFLKKEKIGHHLMLSYTVSFHTKKGLNIMDLSLGYSLGLRNIDVLYIRQEDNLGNQNSFISKSRGTYFSIGLSRKFHFKLH